VVMFVNYHLMLFTWFVLSPEMHFNLGYSLIYHILFLMAVNFMVMGYNGYMRSHEKYRLYKAKKEWDAKTDEEKIEYLM
jgi:hypothetical protein